MGKKGKNGTKSMGKKKGGKGKKRGKRGKKRSKNVPINWRIKAMYGLDRNFDSMTNDLKDIISTYRQTDPLLSVKQGVASALRRELEPHFEKIDVVLVGSSSSKLAFDWSDVDLTIITNKQEPLTAENLSSLVQILANQGCVSQIKAEKTDTLNENVTIAFHYSTYLCGFKVHLSINDVASVFHAYLLHTYNKIENRFAYVLLPVKQWARNEGLLNPNEGKLSGYLITLMVIFYLQAGLIQPVLPSLQNSAEKLFKKETKNLKQWKEMRAQQRLKVTSKSEQGIAELFIGFFIYYKQFDFQQFEIDIVTGEVRPRVLQGVNYKKIRIAIRDPFLDRVASSFVTQQSFVQDFKEKLSKMESTLEQDEAHSLEELLQFAGNTRREETKGRFTQRP